jgi:SAM-dependent methyltransferase
LCKINSMKKLIEKNIEVDKAWFKHWFDSSFYHKLYAHRNEKEAANFIDELISELQPAPFSRMLDLGCGNGRHCKQLAAKGFNVIGIDLAASGIREAKKWESKTLRFYRQDMRIPFGKNSFDYVFNFFTSFGYFNDPADDHKVVANISAALRPDGILVMDYINSAPAEKKLKAAEDKEIDGVMYHISRWTDEKHFFKKIVIDELLFGEPLEYIEQVKKISVDDFEDLFKEHGLRIVNVFGNYQLNNYDQENSPRIILIAKKNNYEKKSS